MPRLENKVAIITGAASGIGAATAALFVREGARVVIADSNRGLGEAIAKQLGSSAVAMCVDVSSVFDTQRMVDLTVEQFGPLDILVNNAGIGLLGTVETMPEDEWDTLMAVNLKGIFLCSKFAIPAMRAAGGGAIVNTASNVAAVGVPNRAAYVASKGGVAALTRAMAVDHVKDGIRVNAVAPGIVWSPYYDRALAHVPDPEAFRKMLETRAPMGRTGTPEEIAAMILWLASDESSFATGATFTVDGGMSAW